MPSVRRGVPGRVRGGSRRQVHKRSGPQVFRAFVKSMGSPASLITGSVYHKNTNAKVERANCIIGDTMRAYANGRKDDWAVT